MLSLSDSLEPSLLRARYQSRELTPTDLVHGLIERLDRRPEDHAWISLISPEQLLARARDVQQRDVARQPLYGIPFAVKDNIDVAGLKTTAACPAFAYRADTSSPVVAQLLAAGAILLGKTNMDQFATGLVGTRSPYGAVCNAFNGAYIAGGSSAGSAVAVAAGLVSFALGTDTAGSGRVPAAFNNIVGLKPTRGLLSSRGIVPACRSLDCVSIFALSSQTAWDTFNLIRGFDPQDPFSRPAVDPQGSPHREALQSFRFGVPAPAQMTFLGNASAREQFGQAVDRLAALGGEPVEIDFAPFMDAAQLLYEGPWVAERYLAIRDFLATHADAVHPVTRSIIASGAHISAADGFAAYYRLKALRRDISPLWQQIELLVTPTAGTIYTMAQVEADPVRLNTRLGYYTNFVNLLDLSAIAVPAGFLSNGLPFGITLVAPAFSEAMLCLVADAVHRASRLCLGTTEQTLLPWETPGSIPAATMLPSLL